MFCVPRELRGLPVRREAALRPHLPPRLHLEVAYAVQEHLPPLLCAHHGHSTCCRFLSWPEHWSLTQHYADTLRLLGGKGDWWYVGRLACLWQAQRLLM